MLLAGAIFAIMFGLHITFGDYGCPGDPASCYTHCNKEKGCLTGYCDMFSFFMDCKCQGCSKQLILRYRDYGCKMEKGKKNCSCIPQPGNMTFQDIRDIFKGKYLKSNYKKPKGTETEDEENYTK